MKLQNLLKNMLMQPKNVEVINYVQKSVLYNDRDSWVKKDSGSFDNTMGVYDGMEVYELIGIYNFS